MSCSCKRTEAPTRCCDDCLYFTFCYCCDPDKKNPDSCDGSECLLRASLAMICCFPFSYCPTWDDK